MRIAYCEDEPAQRSRMELLLHTFAERKRLPLTVEAFSDSAAFLFHYPDSYPFDLIFLDIDLGGMDGMALARKIRETDSEVPILFLTNHREYVFEGYEVQAFRYLLKPVTEDTLFPLLDELQAMRGQEKPHLLLSLGGETQKLFLSDLLFVESDNHYLTLHTAAGTETFKKNLSEFREELSAAWQASGGTGECFAAAHRSYLVNLAHVERITRTECLLSDGTKNSGQPRMLCITQPGVPAVLPAECVLKVLHFLISNSERTEVMFHGAHSIFIPLSGTQKYRIPEPASRPPGRGSAEYLSDNARLAP